jgi:hypothetical protein
MGVHFDYDGTKRKLEVLEALADHKKRDTLLQ